MDANLDWRGGNGTEPMPQEETQRCCTFRRA
jgi:hypothetical protein